MRRFAPGALALITIASGLSAQAQTTGRPNPALAIPSLAGQDLFAVYCATCHERDGAGRWTP